MTTMREKMARAIYLVPDAYADRKLALMNIDRAIEKRKTA